MFWSVCRTNNCQYCQGHQEGKLLRAGQKEDEIAALDGDWSEFTSAQQAAFAFARTGATSRANSNSASSTHRFMTSSSLSGASRGRKSAAFRPRTFVRGSPGIGEPRTKVRGRLAGLLYSM